MLCPKCSAQYENEDTYCRHCGADLTVPSTSLVPARPRLPAVLQKSQLPRRVAAGVGALAFGVGIELARRTLVTRLSKPSQVSRMGHAIESALPTLHGLKDILLPENKKPLKPPKGYEVHETVVYMRRVIRRER